jgi:hypothetical protein
MATILAHITVHEGREAEFEALARDLHGFLAHQTSPHHEAAGPSLRDCIESMTLEWVDPIDGASTLAPSDPQDLPADASSLMTKYAAMIPVHVADWWAPRRNDEGRATA